VVEPITPTYFEKTIAEFYYKNRSNLNKTSFEELSNFGLNQWHSNQIIYCAIHIEKILGKTDYIRRIASVNGNGHRSIDWYKTFVKSQQKCWSTQCEFKRHHIGWATISFFMAVYTKNVGAATRLTTDATPEDCKRMKMRALFRKSGSLFMPRYKIHL